MLLLPSILLLLFHESCYIFAHGAAPQVNDRLMSRSSSYSQPKRYSSNHGHGYPKHHNFKTEISISPEKILLRCKIQEPLEHIVWVLSRCPGHGGGYGDKLVAEGATVNDRTNYDVRLLGANSTITSELLIKNPLSKDGSGVYRCEAWPHGGGGAPYGQYVAQDVYILGGKEMLKACFGGWEAPSSSSYDFSGFAKSAAQHRGADKYPRYNYSTSASNAVQQVAEPPSATQETREQGTKYQHYRPYYRAPTYNKNTSPQEAAHNYNNRQSQEVNNYHVNEAHQSKSNAESYVTSTEKPPMLVFAQQDALQNLLLRYQEFLRQKQEVSTTTTTLPPRSYVAPVLPSPRDPGVPSGHHTTVSTADQNKQQSPPAWSQLMVQSRSSRALYGNGNNGTVERLQADN